MKGGLQVGTKHGMRRLIRNGLLLSLTFDQVGHIRCAGEGLPHPLFGRGYVNNLRIINLIVTGVR